MGVAKKACVCQSSAILQTEAKSKYLAEVLLHKIIEHFLSFVCMLYRPRSILRVANYFASDRFLLLYSANVRPGFSASLPNIISPNLSIDVSLSWHHLRWEIPPKAVDIRVVAPRVRCHIAQITPESKQDFG